MFQRWYENPQTGPAMIVYIWKILLWRMPLGWLKSATALSNILPKLFRVVCFYCCWHGNLMLTITNNTNKWLIAQHSHKLGSVITFCITTSTRIYYHLELTRITGRQQIMSLWPRINRGNWLGFKPTQVTIRIWTRSSLHNVQ